MQVTGSWFESVRLVSVRVWCWRECADDCDQWWRLEVGFMVIELLGFGISLSLSWLRVWSFRGSGGGLFEDWSSMWCDLLGEV